MDAVERNRDNAVPLEKKLDDLYKLIDGIDIAMLTTRRADGHLFSRPMSTQRRTTGTDLWFMTNVESEKFEDLARDPHVNLAYYKSNGEWASVSGTAFASRDRSKIDELYAAALQAGALGGKMNGAGGGGFMMFVCDPLRRYAVQEALRKAGSQLVNLTFVEPGVRTWSLR